MVFVDDGSRDATALRGEEIARRDPRVRFVKFRRNYGQTAAMAAGIEYASGEILITMDGDLQNDPADIEHFLAKMAEGYDIVVGWRHKRQDKLVSRKIPSKIANWLIGKVTGVHITDNGCSLKAFRASLIKRIPLYSEMHRFIPAMASIAGPRIAEIKVRHHARQFGRSKYGLSRIYKVLLDLLVIKTVASFTSRPLLWFSLLCLPLMAVGTVALDRGAAHGHARQRRHVLAVDRNGHHFLERGADADGKRHARRIDLSNGRCAPRALRPPHHESLEAGNPSSMTPANTHSLVSVIVPVGERQTPMADLYAEYKSGLRMLGAPYELIFVLDGEQPTAERALAFAGWRWESPSPSCR